LPLGAIWIADEQAFNFSVYAEHADSVTLLLYSAADFSNTVLTFQLHFLRNKSGRIWHCRIQLDQKRFASYYAYSVSGTSLSELRSFDSKKVLLDPYAKSVFFPPEFDRKLAIGRGPNSGRAPLGVIPRPTIEFDWTGRPYLSNGPTVRCCFVSAQTKYYRGSEPG